MHTFNGIIKELKMLHALQASEFAHTMLLKLVELHKEDISSRDEEIENLKTKCFTLQQELDDYQNQVDEINELKEEVSDLKTDLENFEEQKEHNIYKTSLADIYFEVDNLRIQQQCEEFFKTL